MPPGKKKRRRSDMLSQEGGCEHAILKRIQTGWLKFRELSGLLIGKGMSLRAKRITVYAGV